MSHFQQAFSLLSGRETLISFLLSKKKNLHQQQFWGDHWQAPRWAVPPTLTSPGLLRAPPLVPLFATTGVKVSLLPPQCVFWGQSAVA